MLPNCSIQSPLVSTVLDCCIGRMYAVSISDSALLKFLQNSKRDSERLAALHCALLCVRSTTDLEMKVGKEFLLSSFSDWWSQSLGQGYDISERRKILIHVYLLLVPRARHLDYPRCFIGQSWHENVYLMTSCNVLVMKPRFLQSISSPLLSLTEKCEHFLCSHSDRLFGGFLRTYQRVILLILFRNLSLVRYSFSCILTFPA